MKAQRITKEEADTIIETREPRGVFYLESETGDGRKVIVGIDNRTGDAWTEDFNSKMACFRWLHDK